MVGSHGTLASEEADKSEAWAYPLKWNLVEVLEALLAQLAFVAAAQLGL